MGRSRILLLAVACVVSFAPAASATPGVQLVAPLPGGVVDFGDTVGYRLAGAGCTDTPVRVTAGAATGAVSMPQPDPLAPGTCVGYATVPSQADVRATGWAEGDPLQIDIDGVALRYQRAEVDLGTVVAGAPATVASADPRSGPRDRAVQMSTGDAISLGRIDLTKIYSVSVRVCIPMPKPHVPAELAVRVGSASGPSIVGPVDVSDDLLNDWKAIDGWPDCWQLLPWPITGAVPERAPELFLVMLASPEPVLVTSIDFNGTGAHLADVAQDDPSGTRTIFDGTSFDGWNQSGCVLADGAVRTAHANDLDMGGCTMTYAQRKLHDVMIRLDYRLQDFATNGAVTLGHEIQMREAGEWLTGGYLGDNITPSLTNWAMDNSGGGYPAQRIKSNSYPDWSRMEIVQVGARYIVRINGRTVTDHVATSDPAPYAFAVSSQPDFSEEYGVGGRFDTMTWNPTITTPSDWGNAWYRNIRVYDCAGAADPVCVDGPGLTD